MRLDSTAGSRVGDRMSRSDNDGGGGDSIPPALLSQSSHGIAATTSAGVVDGSVASSRHRVGSSVVASSSNGGGVFGRMLASPAHISTTASSNNDGGGGVFGQILGSPARISTSSGSDGMAAAAGRPQQQPQQQRRRRRDFVVDGGEDTMSTMSRASSRRSQQQQQQPPPPPTQQQLQLQVYDPSIMLDAEIAGAEDAGMLIDRQPEIEQVNAMLDRWIEMWTPSTGALFYEQFDKLFGPDVRNCALMKQRHVQYTGKLSELRMRLLLIGALDEGAPMREELSDKMVVVATAIYDAYSIVHRRQRLMMMGDPRQRASMHRDDSLLSYFQRQDTTTCTDFQKLLLFLFEACEAQSLVKRKDSDMMLRPVFVPLDSDSRHRGAFTYSYQEHEKFLDFVHQSVFPMETYFEQWQWVTTGGNARYAAEYLQNCVNRQLPYIRKDRHRFAFQNGVYLCDHDVFYSFDDPVAVLKLKQLMGTGGIGGGGGALGAVGGGGGGGSGGGGNGTGTVRTCVAKYHNYEFCEDLYKEQMAFNGTDDWFAIQTPKCQSILDHQQFDEATQRIIYMISGRMLFCVGELDNFQIQPYIRGMAATGKSTWARFIALLYEKCDVGYLSNNVQEAFAVEAISDSFLYFGLDLGKDFRLCQMMWQSMVTGEEVSINRKHRIALMKIWTSPGMFVSNVTIGWKDNAESFARRTLLIDFNQIVMRIDPNLWADMHRELPAFLKKCTVAYLKFVEEHRGRNIWDVLPPYFLDKKKKLTNQTNTLSAFMLESGMLAMRPGVWMTMQEFKDMFGEYCRAQHKPVEAMSEEYYSAIFQRTGLQVVTDRRRVDCTNTSSDAQQSRETWVINACRADKLDVGTANAVDPRLDPLTTSLHNITISGGSSSISSSHSPPHQQQQQHTPADITMMDAEDVAAAEQVERERLAAGWHVIDPAVGGGGSGSSGGGGGSSSSSSGGGSTDVDIESELAMRAMEEEDAAAAL
jgi:uncharacterized membrane protein YgcG